MTTQTIQAVAANLRNPSFVPPVTEHRLGWLAYASGLPLRVCGSTAMRAGWRQANRDEANASAVTETQSC